MSTAKATLITISIMIVLVIFVSFLYWVTGTPTCFTDWGIKGDPTQEEIDETSKYFGLKRGDSLTKVNEPVLESIKYHLEDMRKLVFKTT